MPCASTEPASRWPTVPADAWDSTSLLTALQTECPTLSFFLRDIRLPISKAVQLVRKGAAGIFGQEADETTVAGEVESALSREDTPGRNTGGGA